MVFQRSSSKRFGQRLEPHLKSVWKYALSLSGRPDMADDLLQATCLRALEKQAQFQENTNLIAWLITICRSIWLNELRAQAIRKTGSLDSAQALDIISDSPHVEMNIFATEVFTHMMQLPAAQRETAYLVYVEQFTYREAADVLDVPIGTVMSRLATVRTRLADLNQDALRDHSKDTL